MHKLWTLTKLNMRALLATFSMGSNRKKAAGGVGALLMFGLLALYLSGVYSGLFAQMLGEVGLLDFLLPLMSMLACIAALMFTLFAVSGIVFGTKDTDLMLSLPVSAFFVMLSKLLALYLENLIFCVLWMVPAAVVVCVKTGSFSASYLLLVLLCSLFLPFLPSLIGMLLGYIMALFSARVKRKALITNVLSFVFFIALMIGSFQLNGIAALLLRNQAQFEALLRTWLLPFGLLQRAVGGSLPALFGFAAICALPFLVLVYLFSLRYKKILTGLSSHVTRSDYHLQEVKVQSQFAALVKKEAGRFFGTPIYLFNTGFGMVLLLVGAVASVFFRSQVVLFLAQLGAVDLTPAVLVAAALMVATTSTTCVSLSLEGKTLWILKEAPVSASTLFASKLCINVLVVWVPVLTAFLIVPFSLQIPVLSALAGMLVCLAFGVLVGLFGLCVNLLFPKMDGANDTLIVKQSASSVIAIFGGMLFVGLGALLYWLVGDKIGLIWFCVAAVVILLALSALCWRWLRTYGVKKLLKL